MSHNPSVKAPPVKSSDHGKAVPHYPGRELLAVMAGWRKGDLNVFTL